ncbi:MAG: hypothetical protein Q7J75_02220 [Rhodoferax sp.]|nr:hypothetical protein [Rhodoferax sp.]
MTATQIETQTRIADGGTKAMLLAALKAITAECMHCPTVPPYSADSYLPEHLLEAAQLAIEQANGSTQSAQIGGGA